jgi:hypothetical protein
MHEEGEGMTIHDTAVETAPDLRERAIKRLKKRRDFQGHLLIYTLVNSFLIAIWALTSHGAFFWPAIPMLGWGIGLFANAWDVYRGDELDEDQIRREMERITARRAP